MGCERDRRLAIVIRCGGLQSYCIAFLSHVQEGNKRVKMEPASLETFVNDKLLHSFVYLT